MQAQILLTLKLQQRLFADPRRIALLKQIKITGSISQGAKQTRISYKSAWDAINEMNQLADEILVERATGGKGGGGAQLTHYGERLLQLYDLLEKIQQKAFDVLKEDSLPLDSLLAAISRFSLQTSARNQFFGTIIERSHANIQQHVRVLLADGKTSIYAAVTEQSANRLNLVTGKEVLVLIKAPWITLTKHAPSVPFDNILSSQVSHIETGTEYSEIILTLDGGESLCVTLSNQEVTHLQLQPRDSVTALFNADKVIIATLC
ncbi:MULTISPECIES: molybdenum-dependent transcriptional regulator [Xenorhabdus]|uniref:Molybdate transport repressor ModE n=1 Tax=Xenorhabdus ehlersii TaxID=290111 RepID=A0A2D0IY21_9GAMM|nr:MULTISPECIES: molybdenum-dependent transcriptional regulator [Xenorhabdus]MBC8947842.1 molybdenum-dependent transcriptional regulator [Xenorhabdus sp. TS4]MBC8948756.1 molybdenum-dependent transcriptional regulator [Xenorhabdus sp. TS4]PHM25272.1 molybdenum-dependent transcriptional regulator [Xenorhabdus ehlersii]PHM26849.1 molybdenum-dependent transcriptional regulator [Xenorhabdus ehlersii]RKE90403.1 molybdate transport repressor ModE [Xenorhabdus ehlersii]